MHGENQGKPSAETRLCPLAHRWFPLSHLVALVTAAALLGGGQHNFHREGQVVAEAGPLLEAEAQDDAEPIYLEAQSPLEAFVLGGPDGVKVYSPPNTVAPTSIDGLWEYAAASPLELPFPTRFPKGFRSGREGARFFISPELIDTPQLEWVDVGKGQYYQKIRFPASILHNPEYYGFALYEGERVIYFDVHLWDWQEPSMPARWEERFQIGGNDAFYSAESPLEYGKLWRSDVYFSAEIPETPYMSGLTLGEAERVARGIAPGWDHEQYTFKGYTCSITAFGVEKEIILDFAKSIVFPKAGDLPPEVPALTEAEKALLPGISFKLNLD